jgi:hypothetical protein
VAKLERPNACYSTKEQQVANIGYDWQTLVNKIGDTTSQVVSLEIEYGTSSMIYQNRRHSLDLSLTVFIIALSSSVALFFRSTWTAIIAFLVAMCFLASAIFDFYRAMRESKKMEEIGTRYMKARVELETLKAMLTAKAIADEKIIK